MGVASASAADTGHNELTELLDHRLLVVTGKGGVGKTTVAGSLAAVAAQRGARSLVVELEPSGALAETLGTGPLRYEPVEFAPGAWAMSMDAQAALAHYLRLFVKIPLMGRIGVLNATFDFVARAAPGVREILSLGTICHEVRERHYDLVIVDAPATGHVIELLTSPRVIHGLVTRGPVHDQTAWMMNIVEDPDQTGVIVVTTPEELPVNETITALDRWRDETEVAVAAVVVNRSLPMLFSRRERNVFGILARREHADLFSTLFSARLGSAIADAVSTTEWALERRQVALGHLDRLRSAVDDNTPMIVLPEVGSDETPRGVVGRLGDHLGMELHVEPR